MVPMRVLNVLRKWVQKHPYDFTESPSTEERLLSFIKRYEKQPEYHRYVGSIVDIYQEFKKVACLLLSFFAPPFFLASHLPCVSPATEKTQDFRRWLLW